MAVTYEKHLTNRPSGLIMSTAPRDLTETGRQAGKEHRMDKFFTKGQRVKVSLYGVKPLATVLYDERVEGEGMGYVAIAFRPHFKPSQFPKGYGHVISSAGDEVYKATRRGNGLWIHPDRLEAVTRGRKPGSKNTPKPTADAIKVGDRVRLKDESDTRFVRFDGPPDGTEGTVKAIEDGIVGVDWSGWNEGHRLHGEAMLETNTGWWVAARHLEKVQRLDLVRSDERVDVRCIVQRVPVVGDIVHSGTSKRVVDLSGDPVYYIGFKATLGGKEAVVIPFIGGQVVLAEVNGDVWRQRERDGSSRLIG